MLHRGRLLAGVALVAAIAVGAGGYYWYRHSRPLAQPVPKVAVVISAPPSATPVPAPVLTATPVPTPTPIPDSAFIHVPYTAQAPTGNWDAAHEEYCEAAAVLMEGRYFQGTRYASDRIPATEADPAMGQIVQWERQAFPGVLDIPIDKVGQTAQHFYNLQPEIRPATLDGVKAAIAAGKPVIIPVMTHGGPGNTKIAPFYSDGNVYHVIVITGYDAQKVYTNDAGFVQGQNYGYAWATLDAAMAAQVGKMGQDKVMLTFTPGS